jgi:hypothetical protein
LHSHVAKFVNGEVKVGHGLGLFLLIVFEKQFGQLKPGKGQFGPEAHLGADTDSFFIMLSGPFIPAQKRRRPAYVAGDAGVE